MQTPFLKSILRTALGLAFLMGTMQTVLLAQSVNAHENRIVGVWDVQVTLYNCNTGTQLTTFKGLNKWELGGTAQVVPSPSPTALSAHVGIWNYAGGNRYQLAFKMFRFDAAGTNIGSQVVRFNIDLGDDENSYMGSGQAQLFDNNGNVVGGSCPTITGTRFQ